MNIIVCIKQVPGTTQVDIDPETGVLKRDGISAKMNPYDLYALETALQLKKEKGATVTVISMGPLQAKAVIREAYMMGADAGYLLSDSKFAGSDVLATSYALASGIEKIGDFDLIICGKQTTDGDTAQVGPAIAEHLKIPHVTWVSKIESVEEKSIVVEQNMEDSFEVVRLPFPCLISVEKKHPHPPSSFLSEFKKNEGSAGDHDLSVRPGRPVRKKLRPFRFAHAGRAHFPAGIVRGPRDVGCRRDGLRPAFLRPACIREIYLEGDPEVASIIIDSTKCDLCGECITACPFQAMDSEGGRILINAGCKMCKLCIKRCPHGAIFIEETRKAVDKSEWQGILIFAEFFEGRLHPVTVELIGIAKKLAAEVPMPVWCLLIGYPVGGVPQMLLEYGVDEVFVYEDIRLSRFSVDAYANVFEDIISEIRPSIVLVGSTSIGRSLAPRVAVRFKTGLTADCTTLRIKPDTDLIQIRPAFGGNIMAQIITPRTRPQFATVRYKVMDCAEKRHSARQDHQKGRHGPHGFFRHRSPASDQESLRPVDYGCGGAGRGRAGLQGKGRSCARRRAGPASGR